MWVVLVCPNVIMSARDPAPDQSAWLLRQVQQGDDAAAEAIFQRYAERLTRLAKSRLSVRLAARIDPDDIVMSAYRSFFVAAREGRFTHEQGGDLWRLLVEVTLHKLYRQVEHHQAQRRSIDREQHQSAPDAIAAQICSREPTPDSAAAVADELEAVLKQLPQRGREALELRLQGYTQEEIAVRLDCTERTVRRWLAHARRILAGRAGGGFVPSAARRRPREAAQQCRPTPDDLPIAATLTWSDYLLQQQIGAGASGKVYRAIDQTSGEPVAVKFLRKSLLREPGTVERFAREAATVAALSHPGIVAVHGLGRSPGGGYFLLMDLVPGEDLDRILRRRRAVDSGQAAAWVAEAARIVHFANERGIVHCDLKPSNLLVEDSRRIRVSDFGLAVRLAEDGRTTRAFAGTPAFMAPEQVDGCWGDISPRTDVWGLGGVLFFLLFGSPPYTGPNVAAVLAEVVAGAPVTFPAAKAAEVPSTMLDVLRRSLAKHPQERFASVEELADALSALEGTDCVI